MAILNKIRQRSLTLILVIAMALFSFVLADLFRNQDGFDKSQSVIAIINGEDVDRGEFMSKVEIAQRQSQNNQTTTQIMNRVWDQEVRSKVMQSQYEALGLSVERDYMRDLIKQNLASFEEFKNEAGLFDEEKLNEFIANLKAIAPETTTLNGSAINYESWTNFEKNVAINGVQRTYFNMVKAGIVGTLTEGELNYKLDNDKVDVQYIQLPYALIPDSLVSVKKSEIKSYIKAHPSKYEVKATRDIAIVHFKEAPSVEDEQAIENKLKALIEDGSEYNATTKSNVTVVGFKNTTENELFVNANSAQKYNDAFVFKSALPKNIADLVYDMNVGEVYGPYKEGDFFKISKLVATKSIADSAKVRHILVPFIGGVRADASVTKTDLQAKATADSIYAVLKVNRSKFKSLLSLSSDKVSNENDGEIEFAYNSPFAPEFKTFSFENPKGSLGVVKTDFGYHVIEILSQGKKEKAVKVATIAQEIEASEATIDEVFNKKSKFEIAVAGADFDAVAAENNYSVAPLNGVKELDEMIPNLGSQRAIVRWAFEDGTDAGDIKSFNISGGGYVVVKLVSVNAAGSMSIEKASITALPEIKKAKKAELLIARNKATTLEALSEAEGQSVKTSLALTMKSPTLSGAGQEPLVVGTAFGLSEGETSPLLVGDSGVFMVKVTKATPADPLPNYQAAANRVGTSKSTVVNTKLYNALKAAAEIEDYRANFY